MQAISECRILNSIESVAVNLIESPASTGGFPLQFSRPASLAAQGEVWYRSLDGHRYQPVGEPPVIKLAEQHRPAIHACLSYGVAQGHLQPSELSALFKGKDVNDAAALQLASQVMEGIGQVLHGYRDNISGQVTSFSKDTHSEAAQWPSRLEWYENYWLPELCLWHVENDGGEFGENADTMMLRLFRDHYVAYIDVNVWAAPEPLQPLIMLALNAFASLADKPIALFEQEDCIMYEWDDLAARVHLLLCDEMPYLLALSKDTSNGEDGERKAGLFVMDTLREQAPELHQEWLDSIYDEDAIDHLWFILRNYHRHQCFRTVCEGLDAHAALGRVQITLDEWASLQNPMFGHPIAQRLKRLCELYAEQPFADRDLSAACCHDGNGDAPLNQTALICTGDESEVQFIHMTGESVCQGEYAVEVEGLQFSPELVPLLQKRMFGDLALFSLEFVV